MNNPLLTKTFKPGAAIAAYRIVKFGADDDSVIQAAAATDYLVGVANNLGASATDTRVDCHLAGCVEVEFGAGITRGQLLTADADGKATPAAPGAGSNVRVAGVAAVSGVAGDIGSMLLCPSMMQG